MNEERSALRIETLSKWWKDRDENGNCRLPLLDLRSNAESEESHLRLSRKSPVNANIVHIPLDEISRRNYELPPRSLEFVVLVPGEYCLSTVSKLLLGKTPSRKDKSNLRKRQPWMVQYAILASDLSSRDIEAWMSLACKQTYCSGRQDVRAISFVPRPRLWQPDPMVESLLLPVLQSELTQRIISDPSSHCEIWDLGAGSGRDVCFLAEQLLARLTCPNFTVVGYDQRYRNLNTEPCRAFYNRRGLSHVTDSRKIDLTNVNEVVAELDRVVTNSNRIVIGLFAVRFWHRPLVEAIAASTSSMSSASVFAISQFGRAFDGASWDFEHPKPKHVLMRPELSNIFQQQGYKAWSILHDRVHVDSDHGRPLIQFVAQRTR
jgi:hypothetical protein